MVGYTMDGPTRDQVMKFIEEKDRIEREIQELHLVLETNNVGMRDPLVDQDGFPRGDIDVYRVRHARHRIICLQNDHKEIMKQIERGLHAVHAEFIGPPGEGASRMRSDVEPMDTSSHRTNGSGYAYTNGHAAHNGHSVPNGHDAESRVEHVVQATRDLRVTERAFVRVNFVSPGSPADAAGIRVDDEILAFGSINSSNYRNLAQIAEVVQHSVGARVDLRLRRGDDLLNVSLTPGPWEGRGLLGCNIVPID